MLPYIQQRSKLQCNTREFRINRSKMLWAIINRLREDVMGAGLSRSQELQDVIAVGSGQRRGFMTQGHAQFVDSKKASCYLRRAGPPNANDGGFPAGAQVERECIRLSEAGVF
jgi:hypothetical protein